MYKSPIELCVSDITTEFTKQQEEHIYVTIQQKLGVNIDKEELIKALQYDREQYKKGYRDALRDAATAISNICGYGNCPCDKGCDVYTDEDCIERIIDWIKTTKNI